MTVCPYLNQTEFVLLCAEVHIHSDSFSETLLTQGLSSKQPTVRSLTACSSHKLPFALCAASFKIKKSHSQYLLSANLGLLFHVRDHTCEMM